MHTILKFIVVAVVGLTMMQSALAERSTPYGTMIQSAWSAFQCSVLAEKADDLQEQKRLFEFGYARGLKFFAALESGEARAKDLPEDSPFSMLLLLQGPTPDFMLGRIFEVALRSALENIYTTGDYYHPAEIQESIAAAEFWKRNCTLIGRSR